MMGLKPLIEYFMPMNGGGTELFMGKDTYEFENKLKKETYEWSDAWCEYANDDETFRVLYIGDSISRGMRYILNCMADGKIRIDNFATSKAVDNPFFKEEVNVFKSQQKKYDMVLFNNGLHGFHLSIAEYERYYGEMVHWLCDNFEDSKIEIVLTTFTSAENMTDAVAERNAAACRAAEDNEMNVIDLYKLSCENKSLLANDGVHWSNDGYELFAEALLKEMNKVKEGL